MLKLESILSELDPRRQKPWPPLFLRVLKKILVIERVDQLCEQLKDRPADGFIHGFLQAVGFSYQVSDASIQRIPEKGRVVIVANHPIGSLDGLALLKLVHSVRPDVRIVANFLLNKVEPLCPFFLPTDNLSSRASHVHAFKSMIKVLEQDEALIFFPAGEVSRLTPRGIRDGIWQLGFLKVAQRTCAPILPVHVNARNSIWFYLVSMLYKPFAALLLPREIFNKTNQCIQFTVGNLIGNAELDIPREKQATLAQCVRQKVLALK